MRCMKAAADFCSELAQEVIAGVPPKPEGIGAGDALVTGDFAADLLRAVDSDHLSSLDLAGWS